jgi:hypothetical protein
MNVRCPKCAILKEIGPDDLLGRLYVCQNCRHIFMWEDALARKQETPALHKNSISSAKSDSPAK